MTDPAEAWNPRVDSAAANLLTWVSLTDDASIQTGIGDNTSYRVWAVSESLVFWEKDFSGIWVRQYSIDEAKAAAQADYNALAAFRAAKGE